MSALEACWVLLAGVGAGTINSIVGSGTLITFPTLLLLGYPPLTANVSNNIGLVAGGASASWGYRRELAGQRALLTRLLPMSIAGSMLGAALLLVLPAAAFRAVVPVLIVIALVLVIFGPRIQRAARARRAQPGSQSAAPRALEQRSKRFSPTFRAISPPLAMAFRPSTTRLLTTTLRKCDLHRIHEDRVVPPRIRAPTLQGDHAVTGSHVEPSRCERRALENAAR